MIQYKEYKNKSGYVNFTNSTGETQSKFYEDLSKGIKRVLKDSKLSFISVTDIPMFCVTETVGTKKLTKQERNYCPERERSLQELIDYYSQLIHTEDFMAFPDQGMVYKQHVIPLLKVISAHEKYKIYTHTGTQKELSDFHKQLITKYKKDKTII